MPASSFSYVIYRAGDTVPRRIVTLDSNSYKIDPHLQSGELYFKIPAATRHSATAQMLPSLARRYKPLTAIYTQGPAGSWNPVGAQATIDDWWAGFQNCETAIGHQLDAYTIFPCYAGKAAWEFNLLEQVQNMLTKRPGIVPIVGIKLVEGGPDGNSRFDDPIDFNSVAAGDYDATWNGIIDRLLSVGCDNAIVRVAYESNQPFMTDFAGWNTGFWNVWRPAMARALTTLKNRSAGTVRIAICPIISVGGLLNYLDLIDPTLYDVLGCDFYNQVYCSSVTNMADNTQRDACWTTQDSSGYGWLMHRNACVSLNKPSFIFEFGAVNNPLDTSTTQNDGHFIDYAASRIADLHANGVLHLGTAFWDVPAADSSAQFTNGAQPAVLASVKANLNTFRGML